MTDRPKRNRKQLGPSIYVPKTCIHCHDEYVPTSGRQIACHKDECRLWITRNHPSRKNGRYVKRGERPTRKRCEWSDCPVVFVVALTGLVPRYCEEHMREAVKPGAIASRQQWSKRTLNEVCRFNECGDLQHPSGRGWCHKHYPIWSVHGVTADKWWSMYTDQGGVCAICDEPLFGRIIVVDHDHTSAPPGPRHGVEHVRGLLHSAPCNGLILGGIETAIRNGWMQNVLRYIGPVSGIEPD